MRYIVNILFMTFAMMLSGCMHESKIVMSSSQEYAEFFDIVGQDTDTFIIVRHPSGRQPDTLWVSTPVKRIICMSSSHVAALAAIDASETICAVSGLKYISDPDIRCGTVKDVGYDAALDYEMILDLKPDLLVTYAVTGAEPPYVSKLRSLGVKTLVLHDHLEQHPLARAEYVRLFGALTGRMHAADSVYSFVRDRYNEQMREVDRATKAKVLINIPYGDAWYIPGKDGYMSRLVEDAGGEIIGASSGTSASSVISLEEAYEYSLEADMWLNPGPCRTREEIEAFHHMFPRFGPIARNLPIYNNIRCANNGGGNDFWERGAVRPDLLLEDLIAIMEHAKGGEKEESLHFHVCM